jgi:hypothetical protein
MVLQLCEVHQLSPSDINNIVECIERQPDVSKLIRVFGTPKWLQFVATIKSTWSDIDVSLVWLFKQLFQKPIDQILGSNNYNTKLRLTESEDAITCAPVPTGFKLFVRGKIIGFINIMQNGLFIFTAV